MGLPASSTDLPILGTPLQFTTLLRRKRRLTATQGRPRTLGRRGPHLLSTQLFHSTVAICPRRRRSSLPCPACDPPLLFRERQRARAEERREKHHASQAPSAHAPGSRRGGHRRLLVGSSRQSSPPPAANRRGFLSWMRQGQQERPSPSPSSP